MLKLISLQIDFFFANLICGMVGFLFLILFKVGGPRLCCLFYLAFSSSALVVPRFLDFKVFLLNQTD